MTPKEKAEELVDKIQNGLWKDRGTSIYQEDAIYCALIAVDEILDAITFNMYDEDAYNKEDNYWQEVKQEIEKL